MKKKWIKPLLRFITRPPPTINVGPLAVAETEPWWLVVNQIIDQAEWETIEGARARSPDAQACMAAVAAGEGVALVRTKLANAREIALDSTTHEGLTERR